MNKLFPKIFTAFLAVFLTTATLHATAFHSKAVSSPPLIIQSDPDSLIQAVLPLISADSIQAVVQHLESYGSRFCLSPNRKDVAEWIQDKLISYGYANAMLDSFQITEEWPWGSGTFYQTWQYNVVADLTGTETPDLYYITGGHYDAIVYPGDPFAGCPGADDNASGTAAAMEIARVLKLGNVQPTATIRFVLFAAEELGLNGSYYYTAQALASGEKIALMLNMDMIGHEPDTAGYDVQLNQYAGSEWIGDLATELAADYCSLGTFTMTFNETIGSDSDPFFLSGYPAIFFQEDHFSPEYHQMIDVDSNMNFPYCAEVTRLACATLLQASSSPSKLKLKIFNPGDGHSLVPRWSPAPENDIALYNVYIGTASGVYDTVFNTTDTSMLLNGLQSGTLYYIAVSGVNQQGAEGLSTEASDRPVLVSLTPGVLIVDDSESGYYNPSDSVVDAFYRGLCSAYETAEYDVLSEGQVTLEVLGAYSSVLWHMNRPNAVVSLKSSLSAIDQYLELGGNIFFTLLQPTRHFTGSSVFPTLPRPGSFLYDRMGIDSISYIQNAAFIRAIPLDADYPLLTVDTLKTLPVNNHHLLYTDALWPVSSATEVYAFGSDYDSLSLEGLMQGHPVGVEHRGNGFNTFIISCPLFYLDSAGAATLVTYVMENVFGEIPSGQPEIIAAEDAVVYPNPARQEIRFTLPAGDSYSGHLEVYDYSGRLLMNADKPDMVMDVTSLSPGLYILRIRGQERWYNARFMVSQ